jgi:hypothetical protein
MPLEEGVGYFSHVPYPLLSMKVRSRCRQPQMNNGLIIQQGQAIDRSRQAGVSKGGATVPDSRQAQVRQRSIIQSSGKGTDRQAGSGAGRVVRQAGSELGQARVKIRRARKKLDWD